MLELLVAEPHDGMWKIIGTQPMDKPVVNSDLSLLKASFLTIQKVKTSLVDGKNIFCSMDITNSEIIPSDLIIKTDINELDIAKNIALNDINNLINQNLFGVNIIDSMDYLESMMKLMNAGIFITNENREDKYFEIIEAAQLTEKPEPIGGDSTYDEEREYLTALSKYEKAQENLKTLETYLNAYDKLAKIRFTNSILNEAKDSINKSQSIEDVKTSMKEYTEKLDKYLFS